MTTPRILALAGGLLVVSATAFAEPATYRLTIDGLDCRFCLTDIRKLGALGVEKEFLRLPEVIDAKADTKTGTLTLTLTEGAKPDEARFAEALAAAAAAVRAAIAFPGFTLNAIEPAGD